MFNSRIVAIGFVGDPGLNAGVFISLVSSSKSVWVVGDSFVFSWTVEVLSGLDSSVVGGCSFLPINASNAEFIGAFGATTADEFDDDDASIESGDNIDVDACILSKSVVIIGFDLSFGINLSITNGAVNESGGINEFRF